MLEAPPAPGTTAVPDIVPDAGATATDGSLGLGSLR
jgi:hypothetical protein